MNARNLRLFLAVLLGIAVSDVRAQVVVDEPWVRGVVPGQTSTGAFMTIRSTDAAELIAVSSPAAATAHIHRMAMGGGMMTMEPVSSVMVPANGMVEFKPGSYHVMLVGLTKPLAIGDHVPLQLTFRDASHNETSITVQATVRDVTGAKPGATN